MNKKIKRGIKRKIVVFIVLSLFCILIYSNFSQAFGIAPSRYFIRYSDTQLIFPLRLINSENATYSVQIVPGGELSKYVYIKNNSFNISSKDYETIIEYIVDLPSNLDPGEHTINILVTPSIIESDSEVNVGLISVHQLKIFVPNTGDHLNANIFVNSKEENSEFTIIFSNEGTTNLVVQNLFEIKDIYNNTLSSENIDLLTLEKNSEKKIIYNSKNPVGEYYFLIQSNYTSGTELSKKNFTKSFSVGQKKIFIKKLFVENYKLGTVANFNVSLISNWNVPINSLTLQFSLFNDSGELLSDEVLLESIIPKQNNNFNLYIDTTGLNPGNYSIKFKNTYLEELTVPIIIEKDKISTVGNLGIYDDIDTPFSINYLLPILVVLIILIFNAYWVLKSRKK